MVLPQLLLPFHEKVLWCQISFKRRVRQLCGRSEDLTWKIRRLFGIFSDGSIFEGNDNTTTTRSGWIENLENVYLTKGAAIWTSLALMIVLMWVLCRIRVRKADYVRPLCSNKNEKDKNCNCLFGKLKRFHSFQTRLCLHKNGSKNPKLCFSTAIQVRW